MFDDEDDDLPPEWSRGMTGDFGTASAALTRVLHKLQSLDDHKDWLLAELGNIEAGIVQAERGRVEAEKQAATLHKKLLEAERDPLPPWARAAVERPGVVVPAVIGVVLVVVVLLSSMIGASLSGDSGDVEDLRADVARLIELAERAPAPAAAPAPDEPPAATPEPDGQLALEEPPPPSPEPAPAVAPSPPSSYVVVHSSSPSRGEAMRIRDRAYGYLAKRDKDARVCLTKPVDGRALVFFTSGEGLAKKDAIIWAYKLTVNRDSGTQFAFPDAMPAEGDITDCTPAETEAP
jgi:hypothetical protein